MAVNWLDVLSQIGSNPLTLLASMAVPGLRNFAGALVTNPFFSFAQSQRQSDEEQANWDKYVKDWESQVAKVKDVAGRRPGIAANIYEQGFGDTLQAYGRAWAPSEQALLKGQEQALGIMEELPGQYGANRMDFLRGFGGLSEDIQRGYGDRYRFAEEELKGYGEQQKADIDRMFDEQLAETRMNLLDRGLLSSTEAATADLGSAERRSAEQRRLGEDLTRSRLDFLTGLSGEQLSAQERLGLTEQAYDAAMRGDVLGMQERLGQYYGGAGSELSGFYGNTARDMANLWGGRASDLTNIYTGTSGDYLNALMNIGYAPPQPTGLSGQLGYGAVQPASAPSSNAGLWAGGGSLAGSLLGTLMLGGLGGGGFPNSLGRWR